MRPIQPATVVKMTPSVRIALACAGAFCFLIALHGAETNPPGDQVSIPKSIFVTNDVSSKDPFFPNSRRWPPQTATTRPATNTTPVVERPDPSSQLILTGITAGAKPIASINGLTFAEGEEQDVRVPGGRIRIKVLKIEEKAVLISVPSQRDPVRLALPDARIDFTTEPPNQ